MRRAALAVALGVAVAAPSARAAGFLAGAGEAVSTPPAAGTPAGRSADARFGPPAALCAGLRDEGRWALQEPFQDLNHDGAWEDGEPYCDANANGHWDGIYADNGKGPARGVHDPLEVRAFAVSDGHDPPVVYASVDQIGLFDFYTEAARRVLADTYHVRAELVVSADHNESSPDSIGLYGAAQTPLGVGLRSGIDEYFMRFLEDRIAAAAAQAVHNLRPARLRAVQVGGHVPDGASGEHFPLEPGLSDRISDQFPTSVALPRDDRFAAIDPKLGVLQALPSRGTQPIFTVVSIAAHNQEMGNAGVGLSADWPGALERSLDRRHLGLGVFLVGDNGSQEDPQTEPPVIPEGSENHHSQLLQWRQALATGERFAAVARAALRRAQSLRPGPVRLLRRQLCVPLENNGFVALAGAGVFGLRQGYTCDSQGQPVAPVPNGSIIPTASTEFRTFVGYTDIGPDLQLLDNPGESFPALMLGSPFGPQDESCDSPNPPVPTWQAHALYRFQVGLADDLIGYLIPPWGFASGTPGLFTSNVCSDDLHGHRHKLESESVGPTGAADVARTLTQLLSGEPDPRAAVGPGRFVRRDGSLSRWPTGAVGALIGPAGTAGGGGTLVGGPALAGAGGRAVDATGLFMDYDGQPQAAPDVTTRGMMLLNSDGCVTRRYYLNVFPDLQTAAPLGAGATEPAVRPSRRCRVAADRGTPELQPSAASGAGLHARRCRRPHQPGRPAVSAQRTRTGLRGRARSGACAAVARVVVRLSDGKLRLATGRRRWHLRLAPGQHPVAVAVIDTAGRTAHRGL